MSDQEDPGLVVARLFSFLRRIAVESELSLAGRKGAYLSWANTEDRTKRTAPGRAALEQKFLDQAEGDPKRAEALRKAYYADLSLKAVQARRRRAGGAE